MHKNIFIFLRTWPTVIYYLLAYPPPPGAMKLGFVFIEKIFKDRSIWNLEYIFAITQTPPHPPVSKAMNLCFVVTIMRNSPLVAKVATKAHYFKDKVLCCYGTVLLLLLKVKHIVAMVTPWSTILKWITYICCAMARNLWLCNYKDVW